MPQRSKRPATRSRRGIRRFSGCDGSERAAYSLSPLPLAGEGRRAAAGKGRFCSGQEPPPGFANFVRSTTLSQRKGVYARLRRAMRERGQKAGEWHPMTLAIAAPEERRTRLDLSWPILIAFAAI